MSAIILSSVTMSYAIDNIKHYKEYGYTEINGILYRDFFEGITNSNIADKELIKIRDEAQQTLIEYHQIVRFMLEHCCNDNYYYLQDALYNSFKAISEISIDNIDGTIKFYSDTVATLENRIKQYEQSHNTDLKWIERYFQKDAQCLIEICQDIKNKLINYKDNYESYDDYSESLQSLFS